MEECQKHWRYRILALLIIIVYFILFAYIGSWAWNASMPNMFNGVKTIGVTTMIGFFVLIIVVVTILGTSRVLTHRGV